MFLYGTLRKNESHHDLIGPWLVATEPARIWGRLYHNPAGYPALEIPEEYIQAMGTESPAADVEFARHTPMPCLETVKGDWGWVMGDCVTLAQASTRLPRIDAYEGFHPGRTSLFKRVLAPVRVEETTVPAWVYISTSKPKGPRLRHGSWPPR